MKIPLPSHFGAFALTGLMVVLPAAAVTTMFAQSYYCDLSTQNCGLNNQQTYNPYLTDPRLNGQQNAYNEAFNNFYAQYRNQPTRMVVDPDQQNQYNQYNGQVYQPTDQSWLQRSYSSSRSLGYNPYYYGSVSSARSSNSQTYQEWLYSRQYNQQYNNDNNMHVYYAQSVNTNMQVQYISQERYMQCMQDVVERREQDVQDVYGDYHRQYEQLLLERSRERVVTWQISDSKHRRDRERQVERDFRDRFRDLKRWLDDREDDFEDAYRNDSRECDRVRKEMERQEREQERALERANR